MKTGEIRGWIFCTLIIFTTVMFHCFGKEETRGQMGIDCFVLLIVYTLYYLTDRE